MSSDQYPDALPVTTTGGWARPGWRDALADADGRSGPVYRNRRRTRWTDGSTHLWTSRRRRAGEGEASSGLRYDITGP